MLRACTLGAVLLAVFAGCAQLPTGTSDNERLYNAIAIDDVGYVQAAVKSGKLGVNQAISTPGYREGTPLITVAARHAALKTLRFLIASGANVNARTPAGETALMMASYFRAEDGDRSMASDDQHEQAVRLLVESGASLENEPYHYTPLAYAAYQGHQRIVLYLLERGARVNADAEDGIAYVNTPLMMAAIQGHADTALWLLRAGANARIRVYLGHTAAELAQKHNHGNLAVALKCAESLAPGEKFLQRCAGR
jgi:ankyrin repeat protein